MAIEGKALMQEAEKKLSSHSWFSKSTKYEDAAELFTSAANKFKNDKLWNEAGDAFMRAAECNQKVDDRESAASAMIHAATCYKKSNPEAAIRPLMVGMDILAEKGRFTSCARYAKELAEIFEEQLDNQDKAMEYYQKAADWYLGEDAIATANGMFVKIATIAAMQENYTLAIDKFEDVAKESMKHTLSRYMVTEYLFKAALCKLASQDLHDCKMAMHKYESLNSSFASTREAKLIHDLIAAKESDDLEAFTALVTKFDHMVKLDHWKATILLRVKKQFDEEPSLT